MGDNSDKKKTTGHLFFHEESIYYMKFQNISIHGFKVMLCTRKRDEQTDKPEAICPQLFQSWGHQNKFLLINDTWDVNKQYALSCC